MSTGIRISVNEFVTVGAWEGTYRKHDCSINRKRITYRILSAVSPIVKVGKDKSS